MDYTYEQLGIRFSFGVELRDEGQYGTRVPADQIIPNAQESLEAVKVCRPDHTQHAGVSRGCQGLPCVIPRWVPADQIIPSVQESPEVVKVGHEYHAPRCQWDRDVGPQLLMLANHWRSRFKFLAILLKTNWWDLHLPSKYPSGGPTLILLQHSSILLKAGEATTTSDKFPPL